MENVVKIITDCESPVNTCIVMDNKRWNGVQKFSFATSADVGLNLFSMDFYPVGYEEFDLHDMSKLSSLKNLLEIEAGVSAATTKIKLNDIQLKNVFGIKFNADLDTVDIELEIFDSNFQRKTVKIQELDAYNK